MAHINVPFIINSATTQCDHLLQMNFGLSCSKKAYQHDVRLVPILGGETKVTQPYLSSRLALLVGTKFVFNSKKFGTSHIQIAPPDAACSHRQQWF
jgi:hypothetical protein